MKPFKSEENKTPVFLGNLHTSLNFKNLTKREA